MKFQLPAIALLAAASQFSVAEMPHTSEIATKDLTNYTVAQQESNTAEAIAVDAGTLPGGINEVASSLELKLERRLQASFELGFVGGNEVASAH